jgi:ribosomal protein L30E
MLHITYGSTGTFYVTTEEKRIDTSVPSGQIRLLFKFTNDMDKRVVYAYGQSQVHNDAISTYQRYTKVNVYHNTTENVFLGRVNFKPFGYWKYEIYEVSWIGTVTTLDADTSPITETDVADETGSVHGRVKGLVETGKLYVTETVGSEQITYTEHPEPSGTNYIWTN